MPNVAPVHFSSRALLVLSAAAVLAAGGCGQQKEAVASTSASAPVSDSKLPDVLATIGDEKITMTDVRARAGDQLDQLESQFRSAQYKTVETTLDEILRERVLMDEAKRQGKTIDQLVAAEAGGSLEPSDVEISAWYTENPSRTGGRPLEQLRPSIADFLRNERKQAASQKLQARLNAERKVLVSFEPYRVTLDNEGAPAVGPANAPVTLVEFSDFECPFCGRFAPTLKRVEEAYGDKVRIVYRQLPLTSIHPNAFKAAEASLCAHEQGKFWQLHDAMFQDQKRIAVSDLKARAGELGLDRKQFDSCLDTGKFTARVQDDVKVATRLGINGTPALFVNGVRIEGGAVPFESVKQAIDKELARSTR
jgi:protein-disulfide isomerase